MATERARREDARADNAPDAQAAVLVIGRRIREPGRGVSLARANLQAGNLTGANLTGAPRPSGAGAPKG